MLAVPARAKQVGRILQAAHGWSIFAVQDRKTGVNHYCLLREGQAQFSAGYTSNYNLHAVRLSPPAVSPRRLHQV